MSLFLDIYEVVKRIPRGKVRTYGSIAAELGLRDVRKVGYALHVNRSSEVPCHRVVNREGRLAPHFAFDGWREQKRRLLGEGVTFRDDMHVDLQQSLFN